MDKYKWKYRILLVETPDYDNKEYKEMRKIFEKYHKEFDKRFVKLVKIKKRPFKIKLIGFDGEIKATYNKLDPKRVFSLIESMPMGSLRKT